MNIPNINSSGPTAPAVTLDSQNSQLQSVNLNATQVVTKAIEASQIKPSSTDQFAQPTREVIAKAAEQMQNFVQSMGRDLSFSVDQTTGFHVVTVINPTTGEVVRQLPGPEVLKIAQSMAQLKNALVSQKA